MKIRARVSTIRPDRSPYKQYAHTMIFDTVNLHVELEVDDKEVLDVQEDDDGIAYNVVTTAKGYAQILMQVADAIEDVEKSNQTERFNYPQ